jgi:outer membrane protein TolC
MSQQNRDARIPSRGDQEATVNATVKRSAIALTAVMAACWLSHSLAWAQPAQPSQAPGRAAPMPDALPHAPTARRDNAGIAPPPESPPTILKPEVQPIDLTTALKLAGVQNPELNIARTRVLEAVAMRQLAAAYFLPSINPGVNYDSHTGNLQQSSGNILGVNRSAVYVGAGANAVAAGAPTIPGVFLAENVGLGIYNYLASKQTVQQREFIAVAVLNQIFLQVTWAYSELLRAEGRRAAQIQARDEASVIAKITRDYAAAGQGREADANRAVTQLARREALIQAAEAEVLTASARLCKLLNLDPSIRLHPTDAFVVPHPLVPDPIPVAELIALGLLNRPELGAQRAAIQAALMNLYGARILPFSPTTLIGFSAGGFAGGSNLVSPVFGGMSGRTDLDVIAFWTIQNMGLGNIALIRFADAQLKVRQFEQIEILNRVRADVAEAYAKTHARYAQIGTYEDAVRSGHLAFHEDLDRTLAMGADRPRDVLPIELLNSFDLLANARIEYIDAIVDYNRAQFDMYVALGQPPANALAHPVPTEGVTPQNMPRSGPVAPVAPAPPLPGGPQASVSAGGTAASPAVGAGTRGNPPKRDAVKAAKLAQPIPQPRPFTPVVNAVAR